MPYAPIRILLVDDELSIRRGLRMQFDLETDLAVVGEASDGSEAVELAGQLRPDVVLMDIRMPKMDGLAATTALQVAAPGAAVIVLSMFDDAATRERAIAAGAQAFVGKHESAERLLAAIRSTRRLSA